MLSFDEKKQLIDELRKEWRMMWWERIDDRVRAEGISDKDYLKLFVEQGTVIVATRKFRPPDFYDILQRYMMRDVSEVVPPLPSVGGWRKFIRTTLEDQQPRKGRRRRSAPPEICRKRASSKRRAVGAGFISLDEALLRFSLIDLNDDFCS